jgi:hypothetical protein
MLSSKMETEFNLRNVVFKIKAMTTDNVQNSDSYVNENIPIPGLVSNCGFLGYK